MRTILKVICDNRGQASIMDDYLARFAGKAAQGPQSFEFPSPYADDVVFARDDANETCDKCAEKPRAQLGILGQSPNHANGNTKLILMNPIVLSYRRDGQNLRVWVRSPSPGRVPNTESE